MEPSDFAQPPPPKRQRTQSHSSTRQNFSISESTGHDNSSSSRSTYVPLSDSQQGETAYGRAVTVTTERSEDDADTNPMGLEATGSITLANNESANGTTGFTRADSSGLVIGKDKDSDGGTGNGKNRPLAVTCTHCRSRKISMYSYHTSQWGNLYQTCALLQSATMESPAVTTASSERQQL